MPETLTARAPGRVNLIGDHTDYTSGWCFPIAIDRHVEVSFAPEPGSDHVELTSEALGTVARVQLATADVGVLEPEWARYVAAVAKRLASARGGRGTVRSTLPIGSGLSSSAALEVAVALVLGGGDLDPVQLAQLCRDAEHEARGVPTGILDQLSSICGRRGHALLIDCSTLEVAPVPLPGADEVEIVVLAGEPRSLERTRYAERVRECARAEQLIGPLRAADEAAVAAIEDETLRRRARHVVTENARVHAFAAALAAGRTAEAGSLMFESHWSLSRDYESSTSTIDRLCTELRATPGVLGARITGGGWGGCVVALSRPGVLTDRGWPVTAAPGAAVVAAS